MARYGIAVDINKCTGCHNCFIACKDEFSSNDYLPLSAAQPKDGQDWIRLQEVEQGQGSKIKVDYIPIMCQHCEEAPCMNKGPEGAVYRRKDGIVIIDPVKAKGHKEIVNSCPYRAIMWNEGAQLPQKCTLCAHMLDNGEKTTRCVECCPNEALVFGDLDDKNSEISKLLAAKASEVEDFKPELCTKPVIKYIGIPKYFIAGEVLLADKPNECLKGAKLTLKAADGSGAAREAVTDFLGDFEFKGLESNKDYVLKAEYAGYKPAELKIRANASKNLGEIMLQK
ncbi:MAG: oxidoreductase [Clostridiales bacterium]|nr:oxidoreductase [Clostridiales bacterium]